MIRELVLKNRSYRRFDPMVAVSEELLRELVDLARLSPSGANRQPLKYFLSTKAEINEQIFPHLNWAAYLKDWPGPVEGARPMAYIVILGDTRVADKFWCDHGIAAQTILLGARSMGLGGCMFASINHLVLKEAS